MLFHVAALLQLCCVAIKYSDAETSTIVYVSAAVWAVVNVGYGAWVYKSIASIHKQIGMGMHSSETKTGDSRTDPLIDQLSPPDAKED